MIKRILYPTDFSEHSNRCVDYILHIRECGIEEVVLLHVADIHIIAETEIMFEESVDENKMIENCKQTAQKKLEALASRFQQAGLKTRTMIRVGIPFIEINDAADEVDASLIVLGHSGHSLTKELLMGSTAEKVARKSKRPVLLIR